MSRSRPLLGGLVVLYFVIALEVLVMISPFAGFFYAAFDPVLLGFARWPATRWLAGFFLPHMVTPPGALLAFLRVAGSVLFLGGAGAMAGGAVRRIIFVRVDGAAGGAPAALFDLAGTRTPLFFADVDLHELRIVAIHDLGPGTGWGDVPTPMF